MFLIIKIKKTHKPNENNSKSLDSSLEPVLGPVAIRNIVLERSRAVYAQNESENGNENENGNESDELEEHHRKKRKIIKREF